MQETEDSLETSKSQIKRELRALHDLGRELLELPPKNLQRMPLSDAIREEILAAKDLKMGALKRQMKHIGAMMREEDADAIRDALLALRKPQQQEVAVFHQIETWRDLLLAGDENVLDELTGHFADIDHQYLRQLVRNAKKEQAMNKPPKSARALFQYLKDLASIQTDGAGV